MEFRFPAQLRPYKNLDRILRFILVLISSHYIVVNGTDYSLFTLLLEPAYYQEMGFSVCVAMILIEWISFISKKLDKKYQWEQALAERFLLQLLLGLVIPALIEFFMVTIYFWVLEGSNVLDKPFMMAEFRIVMIMICFFNLYCITRYFIGIWRQAQSELDAIKIKLSEESQPGLYVMDNGSLTESMQTNEQGLQPAKSTFMVHTITRSFAVPTDDIAYFYRERGHVFLRLFDGNDHLLSQSLDQIEKQLNERDFFRVARHMIVNHKAIVDYNPLTFGKIGITLSPNYKEAVNASKPQARSFRRWMDR